ncbi:MAG: glycosyltransferase [Pseudomonadota bacterium]
MTRVALLGPANSIHLQRWAAALVQRGHAVQVISQHRCERELLPAAAEVVSLPYAGSLGYFRNAGPLRRALARWQPEILNVHYASGYGSTAMLTGFAPTLLSVWGSDVYDFPYESAAKGWLLRRNLRRATAIASTSEAMARQVRRLVPEVGEIGITPFGVDLSRFAPAPHAERPLTVGIVKLLTPKYGVDLLLRAFAGLPDRCRLLIVGDGPQRAELEVLAQALGIAARTEFTGAVAHAEVPSFLNRLDVYVAPSRLDSESFGVAVIEASACALPVVVSDVGGLPEVVRDGETGLVVPREDVPALRAALQRLVLDAALRDRLGRAGRARVLRAYEWGHCVELMERCYERTISRGATR